METGYSSLDIAMLLITALVIWAASRVPVKKPDSEKRPVRHRFKRGDSSAHSIS